MPRVIEVVNYFQFCRCYVGDVIMLEQFVRAVL